MKFILASLLGVVALTGCASTSSVDEVRTIALDAKASATRAEAKANAAADLSKQTSDKLDRVFKQSMMK